MPLDLFHPAVAQWFGETFPAPTAAQIRAWPAIKSGHNALIAAPTGSGKTLAAFMAAIDDLIRHGVAGTLKDETAVLYISPLKALSNDVRINLQAPIEGIRAQLKKFELPDVEIRTFVRTGDTTPAERTAMRKRPPHIVVTTPESLYILLGSVSGRAMLVTTRSVIVDEIHAIAPSKRGAHLALSLERLNALCGRTVTRIGLSATQKPIGEVARFLVGRRAQHADGAAPAVSMAFESNHPADTVANATECLLASARRRTTGAAERIAESAVGAASGATPIVEQPASNGIRGCDATLSAIAYVADCEIIDVGYMRERDLALELPSPPLAAVMSGDVWQLVYQRLAQLIEQHHTTLIFVNTRRMAERLARHLSELLGKDAVTSHHGSLARDARLAAEQKLKKGELRALVATASLELGIDIGDVDLVCQIASPRSISTFLQRVGRANHSVDGMPKGRLFPLSRDDLVECTALLDAVRRGELDALRIERNALDVVAQQIVAEVACREWNELELFELITRAYPFVDLSINTYRDILRMLAEGYTTRNGPRGAYLHRDAVNGLLRASRGARLTSITSGGAIPDTADYQVIVEPQSHMVGTVHEDFAVESLTGDIFQLGNTSYRVLRVERGRLRVEDAQGAPPTLPFWLGEAPGRSDELSFAVSRLREEVSVQLEAGSASTETWLCKERNMDAPAARQLTQYLGAIKAALGVLPTQTVLALERFFDESGGTQLIIHSPFGSRMNRAWGLALRKRFCRTFNFELQAAATEDAIILSLSTSHSFALADVSRYLHSDSAAQVLIQALLDAPMFGVRWRWNAVTALALPRFHGGSRVPPQLQRMKSEDLLAQVFPEQVACLENLVGERQIPDHPLVAQTLHDCLHGAMDLDALLGLLRNLESGKIHIVARDLTAPSPLAAEILNARPYAFLDDAPLEERRTQAVQSRRWGNIETTDDFGALDTEAIAAVREEAWPQARDADELHDALMALGFISDGEINATSGWANFLDQLIALRRATRVHLTYTSASDAFASSNSVTSLTSNTLSQVATAHGILQRDVSSGAAAPVQVSQSRAVTADAPARFIVVAAERLPQFAAIFENPICMPTLTAPEEYAVGWTFEDALVDILRGRLTGMGPAHGSVLAAHLGLPQAAIDLALLKLQSDGFVLRGHFSTATTRCDLESVTSQSLAPEIEWCERHLLARIHRYTVKRLRREIEPVEPRDFMRFLFEWQRVAPGTQVSGPDALAGVLAQLEGFEAPAAAWESEILPARVDAYEISWMDDLCLAGRIVWSRLRTARSEKPNNVTATILRAPDDDTANVTAESCDAHVQRPRSKAGPVCSTPIVLLQRRNSAHWTSLNITMQMSAPAVSSRAQAVMDYLDERGASFFDELRDGTRLLRTELEDALAELVAGGIINSDSFAGLRALLVPASKRVKQRRRGRSTMLTGIADAGRWALLRRVAIANAQASAAATSAPKKSPGTDPQVLEHIVRTLLKRYGVLCWRIVAHEAQWLPPWRELVRTCHRLEARGDIRGGRFIAGLSGEQFALPDAIAPLRAVRAKPHNGTLVSVSGADPLNLLGHIVVGDRLPNVTSARVLYRDGMPIATLSCGAFAALEPMDEPAVWAARKRLLQNDLHRLQNATATTEKVLSWSQ